ncbi:MAG: hypothetical protein ACYTEG_14635 [Planctomycetota bacterium]|jgi:uncharacterized protein (DUF983 family)
MRPTFRRALARMLRVRCPRCGKGPIFQHGLVRAERCTHCDWQFERGHGFWIGGSEIHMFASYGISVVLFIPLLIVLGSTPAIQASVFCGHIVCSLALLRYSRSIFIGVDFYLDPELGGGDDDREDEGVPVKPHPRKPLRRQSRRRPAIVDRGRRSTSRSESRRS